MPAKRKKSGLTCRSMDSCSGGNRVSRGTPPGGGSVGYGSLESSKSATAPLAPPVATPFAGGAAPGNKAAPALALAGCVRGALPPALRPCARVRSGHGKGKRGNERLFLWS